MPVYKKWEQNGVRVAIWKIEEPEVFFREHTGLLSDKKSEVRRLEHLAGRFLLKHVQPDFPLEQIETSALGKPFLPGNPRHFSISHSFPYIGVAIDAEKETGIDVQVLQEKIVKLQYKFLSETEQGFCGNRPDRITLAWAAKEAAFKRYGLGAVDFIRHMPIRDMVVSGQDARMTMEFLREEPGRHIHLSGGIEPEFAWSVTL